MFIMAKRKLSVKDVLRIIDNSESNSSPTPSDLESESSSSESDVDTQTLNTLPVDLSNAATSVTASASVFNWLD